MDATEALRTPLAVEAGMFVLNVVSHMPHLRISLDTNRRTEAWTASSPNAASTVARRMSQCRRWRCMFWLTSFFISATCVEKPLADPGFCRDIWDLIRENGRSCALNAIKRSRIVRIYGPTCRRTRRWNSSSATAVIERSLWNHTSISTQNLLVLETWLQASRIKFVNFQNPWHSKLDQSPNCVYVVKVALWSCNFIGRITCGASYRLSCLQDVRRNCRFYSVKNAVRSQ